MAAYSGMSPRRSSTSGDGTSLPRPPTRAWSWIRSVPRAIWLHVNRARVDTNRGRFADAGEHLRRADALATAGTGPSRYGAALAAATAELAAWQGRLDTARAMADAALASLDTTAPLDPASGLAGVAHVARGGRCGDVGARTARRRCPARCRAARHGDRGRPGESRRRHDRRRRAPGRPGRALPRRDRSRPRSGVRRRMGSNCRGVAGDRPAGAGGLCPVPVGGGAPGWPRRPGVSRRSDSGRPTPRPFSWGRHRSGWRSSAWPATLESTSPMPPAPTAVMSAIDWG